MTAQFLKEMAGILRGHHGYLITHRGMQHVTAVIWGREEIFPLNLDLKAKNGLSRIAIQMAVIK